MATAEGSGEGPSGLLGALGLFLLLRRKPLEGSEGRRGGIQQRFFKGPSGLRVRSRCVRAGSSSQRQGVERPARTQLLSPGKS